MVLCTSLPVAWLWQSENWSGPHPPPQGSHRCPASHKSPSPDQATLLSISLHLVHAKPCLWLLPLSSATDPAKCDSHTLHDAQTGRHLPRAPSGGLCLLEVSPPQGHHSKGGQTQGRAVTQGNVGGSEQGMAKFCVTPENTRYRSNNTAAAATETSAEESSSRWKGWS